MRFLATFLVAIWFVLAGVSIAHADPISGAIAAISALLQTSGIIAGLIQTGIGLAINFGLSLIAKARMKKQDKKSSINVQIQMGDDVPMSFPMGFYAVPGRRKYANIWPDNSRIFVDVIELSSIPVDGRPTAIWVDDRKCSIDWGGPIDTTYGRGYKINGLVNKKGEPIAYIHFYDGTQTEASPYLLDKFAAITDNPFTSDMIGRGIAYAVVSLTFDERTFRSVPNLLFEMPSIPLYDIRKDSTNGGSGPHRWNDRSTWDTDSADNPIVGIYNIARGIYYGNEWVFGGQNLAAFRLPASNWIAAMNECDADRDLATGGIQKQFRYGYDVSVNQEPIEVIQDILRGCNGRFTELGGIFKVLVGAPGAAIYSFTDEDVIISKGQSFEPFTNISAIYNGIEATYPEPREKWIMKDASPRYSSALEVTDGNRRLISGIDFIATPYAVQVQALMKAMIEEERRFRVHQFHLPPITWLLEPLDVISWTSARNGYTNKKFLVTRVTGEMSMLQLVVLKEIDPTDYSWESSDETPVVIGWLGPVEPVPQIMSGWTVVPATMLDASGRARKPSMKISCDHDLADVQRVHVQVRLKSTGVIVFDSDGTRYDEPFEWVLNGNFIPVTLYQARGKYIPITERETLWSAWLDVLTPEALIISDDIMDDAIIQQKIADAAISASKIMDEAVTNLKLADLAVSTAKIQVAAVTSSIIADNAVITAKLADLSIVNSKLANLAVNASKIVDGAITNPKLAALAVDATKIADAAVTSAKIADAALTTAKFASGIRPVEIVATLPTTGNVEGRTVYLTTDDKLYRYNGTAFVASVAATDMTGQLTAAQIASITAAQLTGQITSTQINDGAITTPKIFAGAVVTASIAAGAVVAASIATDAITAVKIQANAITTAKIATGAVTANELAADSVVAGKVAAGAISATEIAAGAITTVKLAAGAVTANELAANSVVAGKVAANAIVATNIAAQAVTVEKMVMADFTNFMENPNFEAGDVSWVKTTGVTIVTTIPANAFIGDNYMRIGPGAANVVTINNNVFPVVPGTTFLASATVRVVSTPEASLIARIRFMTADKTTLAGVENFATWTSADPNSYVTKTSGTITVPAGAVYARFDMQVVGTLVAGIYFVGAARVQRKNAAELIIDGSIIANMIAANSISAKQIILADFENFIPDGQFEQSVPADIWNSNYTIYNTGSGASPQVRLSTVSSQTGRQCLLLDNGVSGGVGAPQVWIATKDLIPVTEGDSLAWDISTNTNNGASGIVNGIYFRISWFNRLGVAAGQTDGIAAGSTPLNSWKKWNGIVSVPANVTYCRVQVFFNGNSGSNILFIDRISLRKAEGAELVVDGTITASKIAALNVTAVHLAAGAVIAGKIAAGTIVAADIAAATITGAKIAANTIYGDNIVGGTITARELILTDINNLTADPNFSNSATGASGWTLSNGAAIQNASGYVGAYSLYLPAGSPQAINVNLFDVTPGDEYRITAYAVSGASSGSIQIRARFQDASGAFLGAGTITYTSADPGSYTRKTGAFTAPAGSVKCRVDVIAGSTIVGAFRVGFVGLFQRANAELIVDGAITANHLAANSVTAGAIAANSITATHLQANSVTAAKINVTSLDAISATLGTVNISNAIIGTLQVGTSNISPGAVSVADSNELAGGAFTSGTRDVQITLNHGTGSPTVIIMGSAAATCHPTGTGGGITVQARAGATLLNQTVIDGDPGKRISASVMGRHIPASGTSSTVFTIRMNGSGLTSAEEMNIVGFVLKR